MKKGMNRRDRLVDAISEAKDAGAEFVTYGERMAVRIDDAIAAIGRLPDDLGDDADTIGRWYECDADGHRIVRTGEIYGGLTRHEAGIIVWEGSADVYCGTWVGINGLPMPSGVPDTMGARGRLVAVCLDRADLDDDTLELAFRAAAAEGDRSPSISEAFRVNGQATVITFDGWL